MNMNTKEKFFAINALRTATIGLDKNKNYYIEQAVEISNGGFLESVTGRGASPVEAIEAHWDLLTSTQPTIRSRGKNYRWNGFMWEEIHGKDQCG